MYTAQGSAGVQADGLPVAVQCNAELDQASSLDSPKLLVRKLPRDQAFCILHERLGAGPSGRRLSWQPRTRSMPARLSCMPPARSNHSGSSSKSMDPLMLCCARLVLLLGCSQKLVRRHDFHTLIVKHQCGETETNWCLSQAPCSNVWQTPL